MKPHQEPLASAVQNNARAQVAQNLPQLAQELVFWRRTGKLPVDSLFAKVADSLTPTTITGDEYQRVETYVVSLSLRHAAGLPLLDT